MPAFAGSVAWVLSIIWADALRPLRNAAPIIAQRTSADPPRAGAGTGVRRPCQRWGPSRGRTEEWLRCRNEPRLASSDRHGLFQEERARKHALQRKVAAT
jgi:hypothetical protein